LFYKFVFIRVYSWLEIEEKGRRNRGSPGQSGASVSPGFALR
jgi:hypothetical protein